MLALAVEVLRNPDLMTGLVIGFVIGMAWTGLLVFGQHRRQ